MEIRSLFSQLLIMESNTKLIASDCLKEVAADLIKGVNDPLQLKELLVLASIAWNESILNEGKERERIQELLKISQKNDAQLSSLEVLEVEDCLVKVSELRKKQYPDFRNIITNVEVEQKGKFNHIEVTSAPAK